MHHHARRATVRRLTVAAVGALSLALVATGVPAAGAGAVPESRAGATTALVTAQDKPAQDKLARNKPAQNKSKKPVWTPRPERFAGTATQTDLAIEMDDGVILRGDLVLPADAEGVAVARPMPVLVTITAYNKTVLANGAGAFLNGGDPDYLVKRGYARLTVDARGTGSSEGEWAAFSARENEDAGQVIEWAADQPWSNGKVGMTGASYMGISQLFAASHRPKGLKAIFPQVPAADVYRDVVASGGQIDIGFIPLWLGIVTATGVIPPAVAAQDPASGFGALLSHLAGAGNFTLPLMLQAVLGGDPAYDGPFYRERSPIEVIDKVDVPTFFVGGQFDLFQRGTPLDFEALQRNGVPTKFIFGPWDHLQGSSGAEIGEAGYGSLVELQLRWFDKWIRGRNTRLGQIAPLTYYEQGTGTWVRKQRWIDRDLTARSYRLSGSATTGGAAGSLTTAAVEAGESTLLPIPVTGLCTRSSNQWTAGLPATLLADLPCFTDNSLNDMAGLVFDTEPLARKVRFQGPINARLTVSSPTGDGMLSVAIEDVAPDGTVSRISGGWQVLSQAALDRSRSRYLDGRLIQPFHPFTRQSKESLAAGVPTPVDVEIFPTGAAIKKGHRLRLAVQMFDIPHLLSPLPDLPGQAVPLTLHTGPGVRSLVTLPVR